MVRNSRKALGLINRDWMPCLNVRWHNFYLFSLIFSEYEPMNSVTNNQVTKFDAAFHNLPVASQKLIKNISSMGFDHKRVCRIVEKLGNDDKKVKHFLH